MEESAISSKRGLNDDFVERFAALNIELTTSDADGPSYEYSDEQGVVHLVSVAEGNECDEEKDANENTQHSTQKHKCSFSRVDVRPLPNVAPYSAGSNSFKHFHIGTISRVCC